MELEVWSWMVWTSECWVVRHQQIGQQIHHTASSGAFFPALVMKSGVGNTLNFTRCWLPKCFCLSEEWETPFGKIVQGLFSVFWYL